MLNNLTYKNSGNSESLAELIALRQLLSTNLSALNQGLNTSDSEIGLLQRRNDILKKELCQQSLLIEALRKTKQLPS